MNNQEQAHVSIIEDSEIHSEWLKIQITDADFLNLASVDRSGKEGLKSVKQHNPSLVLLDFQLAEMTGLEVARRVKSYNAKIKIFMLTAHTEAVILERMISDKNIDALAVKGSHYFELNFISAIRYVLGGGSYLEPSILEKLRASKQHSGLSGLSKREFEVFIQINMGKDDQRIADDLCVEVAHIKNMKSRILKRVKCDHLQGVLSQLIENTNDNGLVS